MNLSLFLLCCLLGSAIGLWVRAYCHTFAERIAQEVHQAYCDLFPHNPPSFISESALLQPIKCGHFFKYFFAFGMSFGLSIYCFQPFGFGFLFALYGALSFLIAKLDWHYRLIPIAQCQQLMALGIIGSHQQWLSIMMEQSLQSIAIGFISFFLIYHAAKYYYRQEAFGRGDYWLIAGLSAFIPWQAIPLMIFIACISGLLYAAFLIWRQRGATSIPFTSIPFAPFLNLGGLFTFWMNNVSISLYYPF